MLERIIEILSQYSDYDKSKINRDTSLVLDLGLSSLDVLKIVLKLEEEFNVEFEEDELQDLTTVGDLEDYIVNLQ